MIPISSGVLPLAAQLLSPRHQVDTKGTYFNSGDEGGTQLSLQVHLCWNMQGGQVIYGKSRAAKC